MIRPPQFTCLTRLREEVSERRYISNSWFRRWTKAAKDEVSIGWWKLAFWNLLSPTFRNIHRQIRQILRAPESYREKKNEKTISIELTSNVDFFKKVEKNELTDEQKLAAVIFEDRNLLVAAAGSGKTSCLIGKVGYAIKKRLYEPGEILLLAFNRDAKNELNERIKDRLSRFLTGRTIKAHTFHALGRYVVKQVARAQGGALRVLEEKDQKKFLQEVLNGLKKEKEFLADWVTFNTLYREPELPDEAFNSKEDYDQYVLQKRSNSRGAVAFYALSGDMVRSNQELRIANWLYTNGIRFEYERPFEPVPPNWDQYTPDFYYPDIGVWHEHFAIDAKGEAPTHFDKNYASGVLEKREWLSRWTGDRWFETTSHQCRERKLFYRLQDALKRFGQTVNPRTVDEIEAQVKKIGLTDDLDLFVRVLNLVKESSIDKDEFGQLACETYDSERALCFSKVFWRLHDAYNRRLREESKMDFSDMISLASKYIDEKRFYSPYKLILVDEFQDISPGRGHLLKALLAAHDDSILFGVGDDWQGINGFAGSDLQIFLKFGDNFGYTREEYLTKTFRHPQGIANVGAMFIMKNKDGQKDKTVTSEIDKTVNGLVDLVDVYRDVDTGTELEKRLGDIQQEHIRSHGQSGDKKSSVFLLSRYGLDKTKGISQNWVNKMNGRFAGALDIKFMTMHKSKGLEADYVFMLGLNAGWGLTFPSTMRNDPLVDMLLTSHDQFPDAEERRLFYVALTRAKKRSTIMFRQKSPSAFVLELMDPAYKGLVTYRGEPLPPLCKVCKKGYMLRKPGLVGKLGCSRYSKEGGCKSMVAISRTGEFLTLPPPA